MPIFRRLELIPLVIAAGLASTSAGAEEPAATGQRLVGAIEEVVVTARKTAENMQDVPVPVTALSAQELAETSTFEMKDIGLRVPNMTVRYGPAQPTALSFQIRGQIQNDILGTLDPSIGFYDDGVYVARPHGANASFVDVKSVQVLRGPQGTLFGRNTTGGAILLSTNDPDFDGVSGSIAGSYGSFGRRSARAVLNAPILDHRLGFRMAAETLRTDGYGFDNTNHRDIATEEHDLLRAKLLYEPFDGLSFLLAGQYIDVDQLGLTSQPFFALKPEDAKQAGTCCLASLNSTAEGVNYDSFLGGNDRVDFDRGLKPVSRIRVRSATVTGVWEQPWATAKLIAGVRQNSHGQNRIDIDATPSVIVDTRQRNENLQQSYELQLTGSWLGSRLHWAAGAVYFEESGMEDGLTFALTSLASIINPIRTPGDIDNDSVGGYAQATYELLPRWRLTGGIRHSRDQKRLVLGAMMGQFCAVPLELQDNPEGAVNFPGVGTTGTECKGTFDDSFSNSSFLAGTDYRVFENVSIFDDVLVYFSVTTGYRAGGQNIRGTAANTLTPFKPEKLMQFEGGFKSELLGGRLRLNGAGFHTLYDDIQRSIIVASNGVLPATVVSNAASAEITGGELELTARPPIAGLDLGASFGVTLPRYNQFRDVTGDRTDEKFDEVPKLNYALSGGYTRELFGITWLNRIDWSWRDDTPYQQGETKYFRGQGVDLRDRVTQPAYGVLGARSAVTWRDRLDVGIFGRNLTNERPAGWLVLGGGPDFVTRIVSGPPRELGVDASFRF